MKVPCRRFFAQCALLAPALVLLGFGTAWLAARVGELCSLAGNYAAARDHNRVLEAQHKQAHHADLARREVLAALARGRMTLREAAARFAEMDRDRSPCSREHFCRLFSGNTDEERYCRKVLTHMREETHTSPSLSAVLPRLEEELRELVRSNARRGKYPGRLEEDRGPRRETQ